MLGIITALQGIAVTCCGATVNLHGLRLTYIGVQVEPSSQSKGRAVRGEGYSDDTDLTTTEELPRLLHAGETVRFDVNDRAVGERLVELHAAVSYGFGDSPVRTRQVRWEKPRQLQTKNGG